MLLRHLRPAVPCLVVMLASACGASPPPAATTPAATAGSPSHPAWIARSDESARLLLAVDTKFEPEDASEVGEESADERVVDLAPGFREREIAALRDVQKQLASRRATETDPEVLQDLSLLDRAADLHARIIELDGRRMVHHWDVARIVFHGMHVLLSEQERPERRARAVARLKAYVGMVPGTTPLADLARADVTSQMGRSQASMQPDLTMPSKLDVQKSLSTSATVRDGIAKLFVKYGVTGHEEALAKLNQQLDAYDDFLKNTVLPKARDGFALPPDVYALRLEHTGVDIPQDQLVAMAHAEFTSIQAEMQKVAATVAAQRHLPSADYRDVIRELKKEQITGDAVLPHFQQRLADLEAIIRREHLVTLPSRPARIRLASAAESAQQPAPHMDPPRLFGNTGEQGTFVLPLSIPAPTGSKEAEQKYDDFTYAAGSWTLAAHEARPGHELQFDTMVERGVSLARAKYAFNSTNVEGWGLYSEYIMLPFMPPEGQLVSLQLRLQRAVRAFIDPELQQGKWTFDSARDFLMKEVGLSFAFATSEVERYTFRLPGQATSYFYGFVRMRELRKEAEQKLGARFDAQKFHDAILAEGLLPHDLLRAAVLAKLGAG